MSVYFDGALRTTPSVNVAVVDTAMQNTNTGAGVTLAILGQGTGGKPATALSFGRATDAAAALGGELADAVRAFNPSPDTNAPLNIVFMRVNSATQSTLDIKDAAAATVGTLTSTDYGLKTAQIKIKIETGTTAGLKVTTGVGNALTVQDNIYRNAFSIQYSGGQSTATMTISNTAVILSAPAGTPVATIDLATYPTVQQLVDRINTVTSFAATVVDSNGAKPTLNALDSVTAAADVKTTAYVAKANLQAFVDYLNGPNENLVTFTRAVGAGTVPAVLPYTYLTGGTEGTTTNTDWQNAFTALQTADVQIVVPLSSSASIWAMADTHVKFSAAVLRRPRRAICGMAIGSTDVQAIAAAALLNSDRTALTHLGGYDYDANGNLKLYAPYIVAAMIGGGLASISPGTPMTNKALTLRGLERKLSNPTDTDALINGGVLCVEVTDDGLYKVVQSISTWLTDDKFNKVELSCGLAVDYVVRRVQKELGVLKGGKQSPSQLGSAIGITSATLTECAKAEPIGPGAIVGDANSPAYRNINATILGDVTSVQFECSPAIPNNFVNVTVYTAPYSGTASAA